MPRRSGADRRWKTSVFAGVELEGQKAQVASSSIGEQSPRELSVRSFKCVFTKLVLIVSVSEDPGRYH
jgi:hypothetical protein